MCGARWIPDRHLAVKLLESPENEDGYTLVHFAFPIPAGSRSLVLSSCPPFLVLLLQLLFLLHLLRLLLFIPSSASRRRSHPVRKEEARSKMRYSRRTASDVAAVAVAIGWLADGTDATDGASACHEERGTLSQRKGERERGGRKNKEKK